MAILSLLTLIFWLVLMLYWLFSAFHAKKSINKAGWWSGAWLRVLIIVAIFLFIRVGLIPDSILRQISGGFFERSLGSSPFTIWITAIGAVFCGAGVAFAIWARVYLGRNWGMPMTLQQGHELVTSGPYRLVRHPIYTGFLLAIFGSALADGTVWFFILIFSAIYFIYSAKTEEKIMAKQFPNEYPDYMRRTKMLIPLVL